MSKELPVWALQNGPKPQKPSPPMSKKEVAVLCNALEEDQNVLEKEWLTGRLKI